VDRWGLDALTSEQKQLHQAANGGLVNYNNINMVNRKPTINEIREAARALGIDDSGYNDSQIQGIIDKAPAMSLPNGNIYVPDNARKINDPNDQKAITVHEVEHQSQYTSGIYGSPREVFEKLIGEAFQAMDPNKPNPYNTPGCLEYGAQQVEDQALKLLKNGWVQNTNTNKELKGK